MARNFAALVRHCGSTWIMVHKHVIRCVIPGRGRNTCFVNLDLGFAPPDGQWLCSVVVAKRKGRLMRSKLGWIIGLAAAVLAANGAFAAGLGVAEPWQLGLQAPATPVAEDITSFHTFLLWLITIISLFVLGLLIMVIVKFNAKANPVPSRTTHNTLIEIVWTVVPILILIIVAIPSFRLLYFQRDFPDADMTIKATASQWLWTYDYPDNGDINFIATMKEKEELTGDEQYLLAVDNPIVVPVNKVVRMIVTSSDVIHAWTIPSFGSKIDAVPGRLNETWFRATIEGTYYGQCSELCGKDHAYMPIAVRVVPEADFNTWVSTTKSAGLEKANEWLAARMAGTGKVALAGEKPSE